MARIPYEELLTNQNVLSNAVDFTTAPRAYLARLAPVDTLADLPQREREYLALYAFSEFMTATEDLLGWVAVLKDWDPNDDYSLFNLLDRTRVEPGLETEIGEYLASVDAEGFRSLLAVPADDDLKSLGLSDGDVASVNESIPAKLDGFRKIVEYRTKDERGLVKGFNKVKHLLLAFPVELHGAPRILLPRTGEVTPETAATPKRVKIDGARLDTTPEYIKGRLQRTVESQAVLCDALHFILFTRYSHPYSLPEWVESVREQWGD